MTGSEKLRKYGLNKILAAVIAFTLLCVPFSVLADGSPVTSPLTEPQPVITGLNQTYYLVTQTDNDTFLFEFDVVFSSEPSYFKLVKAGWYGGCIPHSDVEFTLSVLKYDVITGNLLGSNGPFTASYADWSSDYVYSNVVFLYYIVNYTSNTSGVDPTRALYFLPTDTRSDLSRVEPFVTWAVDVPEQIQYKSVLAEPVADTHNRYFIANDKLYWISYYFDNLWVDPITAYNITSHSNEMTAVVTGTASDPNDGDIYYNYDVSITYNDKYYYPLQYMSSDYSFEDMCCPALIYSSSGLRLTFAFDQLSDVLAATDDILVDYRIYCSSFDLITGEYIDSVYSANAQVNNADINISISFDDELASVYCYGVNFVNSQNLPVNLASVLWSYDYVFETWRTDMYVKLAGIYNLLAQSETPSTTTPADYASMLNDPSALDGYNAEDAGPLLSEAASKAQVQIGDGMAWGSEQIQSIFGIAPEMYLVVIIALAFGLAVLILGKKKSDN